MTRLREAAFEVLTDREALARRVADWLLAVAGAKSGTVAIALSGGSTPRRLYELLTEPARRGAFPWDRTHWFWGDERVVPASDPRSNYRMAREASLSRAPVPAAHIHPIPTENTTIEAAAATYEATLQSFYGATRLDPTRPLFDVTLLGLGSDGHTASLFPDAPALVERRRWVAAVTDIMPEPRITLTYPTLESSRHAAFLVAGSEKRAILQRLRHGDEALPAAHLQPLGRLHCFVDAAAMGESA